MDTDKHYLDRLAPLLQDLGNATRPQTGASFGDNLDRARPEVSSLVALLGKLAQTRSAISEACLFIDAI